MTRHDILVDLINPIVPDKKDEKRNFSKNQRIIAWCLSEDRKCGICGNPVQEADYELDHIIPHSIGGRTILSNSQITHSKCNKSKGGK